MTTSKQKFTGPTQADIGLGLSQNGNWDFLYGPGVIPTEDAVKYVAEYLGNKDRDPEPIGWNATVLPINKKARKDIPMCTGVIDYFPQALAAVAELSRIGNEQHNPGQPLHWAKEKSTDHADCIVRHLVERGTIDTDGVRHSAKVAWRALALLQTEIENERYNAQIIQGSGSGR